MIIMCLSNVIMIIIGGRDFWQILLFKGCIIVEVRVENGSHHPYAWACVQVGRGRTIRGLKAQINIAQGEALGNVLQ